jgi:hypothetical protein
MSIIVANLIPHAACGTLAYYFRQHFMHGISLPPPLSSTLSPQNSLDALLYTFNHAEFSSGSLQPNILLQLRTLEHTPPKLLLCPTATRPRKERRCKSFACNIFAARHLQPDRRIDEAQLLPAAPHLGTIRFHV